jgi:hypothetical protein
MSSSPSSFYGPGGGTPGAVVNPTPASVYTETSAFNLVYYGALTAAPTADPFGNPVINGALYFNTTNNTLYIWNGTTWNPYAATSSAIEFIIDGAGTVINTGNSGYIQVPFNCVVTQWTLLADVTSSIVVDVQRTTLVNFNPPTHPSVSDSIAAGSPPTLSSQISKSSTATSNWSTLNQGDILGITVLSASSVHRATLALTVVRL